MAQYPPARRDESVVDDFHGHLVEDPYRWLEDGDSPETEQFVDAQNRLTNQALRSLREREQIRRRVTELWDFPRWSVPTHRQGAYFYTYNDGLQNQAPLYRIVGLEGEPQVLLDPNDLSPDGTVALITLSPTDDGILIGYSLSEAGSDWQTIRVREVATGTDAGDVIAHVKFSPIAWEPDGTAFYYARYPAPGEMPDAPPSTHHRVYRHVLGTDQTEDPLVYKRPDNPDLGFAPIVTEDGRYLVLHIWLGTDTRNRVYYRPLPGDREFIRLLDKHDATYEFIDHLQGAFLMLTTNEAPRGRVISIDLERQTIDEVVPENEDVLVLAGNVGGRLVLVYEQSAHHRVAVHGLDGTFLHDVRLPGLGSIAGISGRSRDEDLFLGFQSHLHPPTVLRHRVAAAETLTWRQPDLPFDPGRFLTEQLFAHSPDGTRIPIFLTRSKDSPRDGTNPTVLYGYGGFNVSLNPAFSPSRLAFLEKGGIVAEAILRGGGEFGEEWHRSGMLERKQNVFADFIAAAEHLIEKGYTSPRHLGIMGGSNGGLLVAACMLQRPELFGGVVCQVPVTDMLRYHRFSAGRYWIPEYGNAEEDPEHFRFLHSYSPLHNVVAGRSYPPILITTAETDDRVVPMHALKFAAALQHAGTPNPVLLRVERRAGHGLGKPTAKVIEEAADVYAFLYTVLALTNHADRGWVTPKT